MAKIDLKKAMRDPGDVFAAPADVVSAASLSREEKIKILQLWKSDAIEISRSGAEGMEGPNTGETLRQIHEALDALKNPA